MASVFLFVFFVLSYLLLLNSAEEAVKYTQKCPPFHCGLLGNIHFPFTSKSKPECGVFKVDCQDDHDKPSTIQLEDDGREYEVRSISLDNTIFINDTQLGEHFKSKKCESLTNLTSSSYSFISFEIAKLSQTFFKCKRTLNISPPTDFKNMSCNGYNIYYSNSSDSFPSSPSGCSIIQLPKKESPRNGPLPDDDNLFGLLSGDFELRVRVSDECTRCHNRGGQCKARDNGKFDCDGADKENHAKQLAIGLGETSLQSNFLLEKCYTLSTFLFLLVFVAMFIFFADIIHLVTTDSLCPICQLEVVSMGHALWSCPASQDVWLAYMRRIQKTTSEDDDFLNIFEKLLGRLEEDEINLVACVVRQIWLRRNMMVFEGVFPHR
ncbi:LEAF RUST 10 DISEASE-RESISTANCE LOCUS RECEPTOR-LIKE PROTEIN KINASE-like 1.1 [Corylus avellana]|uniref:LEAF RUST 10 DISEASE-RESISTANCE LOCUS RECEPTOR-LIKE PROTEIN KINASE-like 1.1 n=1 Tax=Corylus avellana TaxID=13451 RepID=UPI00286AF022|nr:LEAF RUST 10 DISEASE-RESISTANCE LOCUS RECEPTOR-LIKE PROTEIN KINASE-like 1.1 [Corylus avellana]